MSKDKVQSRRIAVTLFLIGIIVGAAVSYVLISNQISTLQSQVLELTKKTSGLEKQVAGLQKPSYLFVFGQKSFTLVSTVSHEVILKQDVSYTIWAANHYVDVNGRVWGVELPKSLGIIRVVDPLTMKLVQTIETGSYINNVEVTPDGKFAFAPISSKAEVWIIDTASFAIVKKVKTGLWPCDMDFTPDGKFAYVPNRNDDTVSVIDVEKQEVVKTVQFEKGVAPYMLTVSPNGKYVFIEDVATRGEDMNLEPTGARRSEAVIDTSSNAVVKYITVDGLPIEDEFTPDSRFDYLTLPDRGQVVAIDVGTLSIIKVIDVGKRPVGLDVRPDGKYVYVSNGGSDTVSVIDTSSNEVVKTISVGKGPVSSIILPRPR